jgi:uncharacterized protein (TIGR00730 family)
MQERKTLMLEMSDAFLVLPGGLGTFDEFFEVVVEAQLGVHKKPIIVVNVKGYFDALDTMLHATVEKGFAKKPSSRSITWPMARKLPWKFSKERSMRHLAPKQQLCRDTVCR